MNLKKIFILLLLVSCGFRPMYSNLSFDIFVEPIKSGINGIDLRNELNARFGSGTFDNSPEYRLVVELEEPIAKYKAIQSTGEATWQEITLVANYTLFKDGKEFAKGIEKASDSYSIVRYLVAANAAYNNSIKNSIRLLSEKIVSSISAYIYASQK